MCTRLISLVAGFLLASILSGCNGSSSGQSVSTGVYKDAGLVSGLQYATPTQSGVTDSNGTFKYKLGEAVTFSVSNVTIGQATGAPILTTFDLVGIEPPKSSLGIPTNNPTSKKFSEAVNISLFLQTLDEDDNPANGIAIPAAINAVVAIIQPDFKITNTQLTFGAWSNFQDSPPFKTFIGSCRAAGVWGGTKAIKKLGYAANNLYQGLGITASVYLPSQITNPGLDFTSYEYTNSGLVYLHSYYDRSNTLINQWTYTYNPDGNIKTEAYIYGPDPSSATTLSYVYDANGNQIRSTYRSSEIVEENVSEYDINGNRTKSESYVNGALAWYVVNTYNANGTLAIENYFDMNNVLTSSRTYTYNSSLLVTSNVVVDGSYSSSMNVEYDQYNQFTKITNYRGGNFVDMQEFAYDALGNLILALGYANGRLEGKYVFTWDSKGYQTSMRYFDAEDRLLVSTVSTYDDNGSKIRVVRTAGTYTDTTTRSYISQPGWGDFLGQFWISLFEV